LTEIAASPDARSVPSGAFANALPEGLSPRRMIRRLLQLMLLGGVTLAIFSAVPGLGDAREHVMGAQPGWLVLVGALQLGSVVSFVVAFRGVFCMRMSWRFSAQVAVSEQAANVLVPAGGGAGLALGAWALRRGGMSQEHIARRTVAFFLLTSSTNFFAVVVVGVLVAVGVLPTDVAPALAAIPAVLAAGTIALVLLLPRLLQRVPDGSGGGRLRRLLSASTAAVDAGVGDSVRLVREGRGSVIAGAWGYLVFDVVSLWAAFQAVGTPPAFGAFLLAYLLGQLGGLIPVPGGIGGTDGGLVAAFALFGAPLAAAAAAVLIYRAFQLGLPALLGIVAFLRLQLTLKREDAPAADCEPEVAVAPAPA